MSPAGTPRTAVWEPAGALVALGAVLALMIWSPTICTRGEAREGLVVRDIVRAGHWVLPERNGVLASKPPLYHWIAAALARPLGLADAVVRLPSVLAALAVVAITLQLGTSLGGRRRGWLAVGALLGCFMFWHAAVEARVDMLFTAFITAALAAFWRWYQTGAPGARAGCYLCAAAAVLTKGPAGFVLPGLVIGGFLLWERDADGLGRFVSAPLLGLAAGPVALWYGLAYRAGGDAFVAKQLLGENMDRFVGLGPFAHDRIHRPLKFLGAFCTHLFPWNLALLSRAAEGDDARARRYLHCWWIAILLFFGLAASKRGVYLLPAYPAVALLAARWLDRHARLPAAWLTAGMLLVDLGVAGATHAERLAVARKAPVVGLAGVIRRTLAPGAPLAAAPGTLENDVLVLAYLLDRPIPRGKPCSTPGAAWLVPAQAPGDGGTRLVACDGGGWASGGDRDSVER